MDFKEAFFKEEIISAVSAVEWHHCQEKTLCSEAEPGC